MPKDSFSKDGKVKFVEKEHKYFYVETGEEFLSVSGFIKLFCNDFDPDNEILNKKAKERNITPEELQKEWDFKRDSAAERGTKIHEQYEHYLNTGKILNTPEKNIIKQLKKIKYKGIVNSEYIIYNQKYKIAGCSDIIEICKDNNYFNVWDTKSNKKRPTDYSFGKKMKFPVRYLNDSTLQKYELQLSTYCYFYECHSHLFPKNLTLLWINPNTEKVEQIPLQYRRAEVKKMLDFYANPDKLKEQLVLERQEKDDLDDLDDYLN